MARVETKLGPIVGEVIVPKGGFTSKQVNRYLGIPYAKPPTGPLRFRRPVPLDTTWSEPFRATAWPAQAVQFVRSGFNSASEQYYNNTSHSEDCLYLNIWSPSVAQDALKPVLVYIHGGSLLVGTSSFDLYDGELLAARNDIVVVTINYRVGTLGFFVSDEVPEVSGNQGLFDQAAALEWIQHNIRAFGGNPAQVTIMGQSAGGWSVSLHVLSPVSRHLFQNAIILSGAAYNLPVQPEVITTNYLAALKKVGIASESDTKITKEIMEKLAQLPAQDVANLYYLQDQTGRMDLKSTVAIDGTFITAPAIEMLSTGNYKKDVKLLASVVEDEASFYLSFMGYPQFKAVDPEPFPLSSAQDFLRQILTKEKALHSVGVNLDQLDLNLVMKNYFSGVDPSGDDQDEYRKRVGIAVGDLFLACPTVNFARDVFRHAPETARVYQLYYNVKTENVKFIGTYWSGVNHCDDLFPLFGMAHRYPEKYNDQERSLSSEMMDLLGSFVRTGTPAHPEWNSFFLANNGQDVVAPYFEINSADPKKPQNFKLNLKQFECDKIWFALKK